MKNLTNFNLKIIDEKKLEDLLSSKHLPILVQCSSEHCAPCARMLPVLESLQEQNMNLLEVYVLDVFNAQNILSKYSIKSVPTFLLFVDGVLLNKATGSLSINELSAFVSGALK